MKGLYGLLSLDGGWSLEGMEPGEGLERGAYRPGYVPEASFPGRVPGIVQAALLEAGRIPDPYWEMNNESILWVEQKEWWYFRRFSLPSGGAWPESPPSHSEFRVELIFEGLAYHADLWLDGTPIGRHEGMFLRRRLDITGLVRPGVEHLLVLRLRALEGSWEDRPGGKVPRGKVRSAGVVAPFTYWWNWSPHLVPIGIWMPVWLKLSGGITIHDPFVRSRIHWDECGEAASADLEVTVQLNSTRPYPAEVTLRGSVRGVGFDHSIEGFEERRTLGAGETRLEHLRLRLERPCLWWPNGLGEHPLYLLSLEAVDGEGMLSDREEAEFGVREFALFANPDDLWVQETSMQSNRLWSRVGNPYPWTFVVNRRKTFIKGSNWVPMDSLFRFSEERYRAFLDLAEEANFNMLRVWGGGIRETEDFYRLCDRKGLLTWTEFWLSCANYPDMPQELFLESASDMVRVIRNHPSLALYCAGNEFNPDDPQNRGLVDRLDEVVRRHDPDRPFRKGSPYRGDRHGGLLMLPTRTSNKYNGDILNGPQRLVLFRSEVAVTRSAPVLESLRKFIGADKLWPLDRRVWQYHHAVIREQERDAREYGGTDSLQHWLMSGQIVHGQVHRQNIEYCRQSKFRCSGCLQWQLEASWPAMHREIVDWWGIPKPAYYACKRACRDYLVTVDLEKYLYDGGEELAVEVHAVSDRQWRTGRCSVKAWIYGSRMELFHQQEGEVDLGENEAVRAFTLHWRVPSGYLRRVFFIYTTLECGGILLAENLHWCGTTGYARKDRCLSLNGPWRFQVGRTVRETEWKDCLMPCYWALPPQAPQAGESVFYRKAVHIPEQWRGAELELFSQGFEGNDTVTFNGRLIGHTEEELTEEIGTDELVFTERWAPQPESRAGEGAAGPQPPGIPATGQRGRRGNVRISSDPFVVPNLIKRFYRIPAEAIRWGGRNVVEIELFGEHATGISEPVFIRAASTEEEQRAIRALDDEGAYLAEMRRLPEVRLTGGLFCDRPILAGKDGRTLLLARLENPGLHLAFFTALSLVCRDGSGSLEDAARVHFSDNYTWLLPGQEREIHITVISRGSFQGTKRVSLQIGGWNVTGGFLPQEPELRFE